MRYLHGIHVLHIHPPIPTTADYSWIIGIMSRQSESTFNISLGTPFGSILPWLVSFGQKMGIMANPHRLRVLNVQTNGLIYTGGGKVHIKLQIAPKEGVLGILERGGESGLSSRVHGVSGV